MDKTSPPRLIGGPYNAPKVKIGDWLWDEAHQEGREVCGFTDSPIRWPITLTSFETRSIIVCRDLVLAIWSESNVAVQYYWGVSEFTVTRWRRELGVPRFNAGTKSLYSEIFPAKRGALRAGRAKRLLRLARINRKKCRWCGKKFPCPPSDKTVTCSKECSRAYKRATYRHQHNPWSEETHRKVSAKGQVPALKLGTPAALESPKAGPFETNVNALIWHLKSPDGKKYTVRNLNKFLRDNPDLFDGTARQAYSGIMEIKKSERGKTRRPVYQWKGWRLLGWEKP